MPQNIMVFLHSEDYRQHGTWASSLAERLAVLERHLTRSQSLLRQMSGDLSTAVPFKGIYLAPEYYFTAEHDKNLRWPMEEDDRVQLEPQLLGLSAKFSDILIVPGTMFYAKPLIRSQNSFQFGFDPATGTRTLPKAANDRRLKARRKLRLHMKEVYSLRTAQDPAFYTSWEKKGYMAGKDAVPSLKAIDNSLKSNRNFPWILRNAAYVLLGPRRLAKYDKQTDWGEALGNSPDNLAFLPGVQKQCPEVGGFRFGVEVCADHANGMLVRRHVNPLHFHFVVSDYVGTNIGNMAMSADGYFAHASTNYQETTLCLRASNGTIVEIKKDDKYRKLSEGCPGKMLDGYIVPLPPPLVPALPPNPGQLLHNHK